MAEKGVKLRGDAGLGILFKREVARVMKRTGQRVLPITLAFTYEMIRAEVVASASAQRRSQ